MLHVRLSSCILLRFFRFLLILLHWYCIEICVMQWWQWWLKTCTHSLSKLYFISQLKYFLVKNKQNNYDKNRNIRFFINLYLCLYLFKVQCNKATCLTLGSYVLTKLTFLLIKYSMPTISIEWTNLFRIKSLNVKFSEYQKQSPGGVL